MGANQSELSASQTQHEPGHVQPKRIPKQRKWNAQFDQPSGFLGQHALQAIHGCLPKQLNRSNWQLVYSLENDGASLQTLLDLCAKHDNCILVIQDNHGDVFGGITGSPWAHNAHYFGAVQSMVFKVTGTSAPPPSDSTLAPAATAADASTGAHAPSTATRPSSGPGRSTGAASTAFSPTDNSQRSKSNSKQRLAQCTHGPCTCTAYRWAGGNRYFQSVSASDAHSSLAMGGGGAFAWSLDEELLQGSSGACDTFASPQLSQEPQFRCCKLEVWALQPALADDALQAAVNMGLGGASATVQAHG